MGLTSLGLDLSLTKSGFAFIEEPAFVEVGVVEMKGKFIFRVQSITKSIMNVITSQLTLPNIIAIEGYAMGIRGGMTFSIGELGGSVRNAIASAEWGKRPVVIIVPPSQLKRFIHGKGNADKREMIEACNAKYGTNFKFISKSSSKNEDDKCDAFCLAQFALFCMNNQDSEIAKQTFTMDENVYWSEWTLGQR